MKFNPNSFNYTGKYFIASAILNTELSVICVSLIINKLINKINI